jgi:hypothetical protein
VKPTSNPPPPLRFDAADLALLLDEVHEIHRAAEAWRRASASPASKARLSAAARCYLFAVSVALLPRLPARPAARSHDLSLEAAIALRDELRALVVAVLVWDWMRSPEHGEIDRLEADAMICERLDALERRREALRADLAGWRVS